MFFPIESAGMSTSTIDVGALLDEGRWSGYQKLLVASAALTIIFDGLDNQLLGAAIPAMMREWALPRAAFASVLAAALFGTFTPFAATTLIAMTGDRASPGFWLMCAAASGFIAAMVIYRSGAVEAREAAVAAQA